MTTLKSLIKDNSRFSDRHIGSSESDIALMLKELNFSSIDNLIDKSVPLSIRSEKKTDIGPGLNESAALKELKKIALKNKVYKSFIGLGYYGTVLPAVIQRNVLENPGWYTQYTPYQAEISQGRLESLLNFQTMIMDLTSLDVANASMLDEGTSAAEAMVLCHNIKNKKNDKPFFISSGVFPQTIKVIQTRAKARGIKTIVGDKINTPVFGAIVQYPDEKGSVNEYNNLIDKVHADGGLVIFAADLLSLALLTPPGELGADIAVGSTQRFGLPLGFGGPHSAYFATTEKLMRKIPGRIIGVSKDTTGKPAGRLALQTREQHIRREKASSNICTSQVLLANISAMWAVFHGSEGIKQIALKIHGLTQILNEGLKELKIDQLNKYFFDTLSIKIKSGSADDIINKARSKNINLRKVSDKIINIAFDETTDLNDVKILLEIFGGTNSVDVDKISDKNFSLSVPANLIRKSSYLTAEVFNKYHSETELMRYIKRLESRDLSLTHSMTPLGSCTMKLNAAVELMPISWPEFSGLHPFCPKDQAEGYSQLINELENYLCKLTGFDAYTLQPNSGAQGELCGLLIIKKYLESIGQSNRNICLIPSSAHGTNPASSIMAGFKVIIISCDKNGNIDLEDLKQKANQYTDNLAALMITYPSTHGVFEEAVKEICEIIHQNGGQVYMDGANVNAQLGLCFPGDFGPDACHLNLHKTFASPHGGGGPGIGPVGVKKHLKDFLPENAVIDMGIKNSIGSISSSPWGSAGILPISWMYIKLMGDSGLKKATMVAILNANYIAHRLDPYYPVLYKGARGFVAHECIIDLRPIKNISGVDVTDVAKRLMDYGFHAPTVSFPVPGTLMIEPTESESKNELDKFCDAMISIKKEIDEIVNGSADKINNVLKDSPFSIDIMTSDNWDKPYSRTKAALPISWTNKFWPYVSRVDEAYGDRNPVFRCENLKK